MDEESAAIKWAHDLLLASAPLTALVGTQIYDGNAPQGTVGDYMTLHSQDFHEIGTGADGTLGAASMLLCVKVITQRSTFASAGAILRAAHTVLQKQTGSNAYIIVDSCVRNRKIPRYPEIRGANTIYQHLGNLYLLFLTYP